MANEGFGHEHGFFPTTNIFYYGDDLRLGVLKWRPTGLDNPILPANSRYEATVYSSCDGLVACRCNATSTYHVGNPFLRDSARNILLRYADLPESPAFHCPEGTHVVLAVVPSPAYLVFCAFRGMDSVYTFETFDSTSNLWESGEIRFDREYDVNIVPNSGVSCGRFPYWLLCDSSRAPTYLLRFNFRDDAYFPSSIASLLDLPPGVRGGRARMQLGRAMGTQLGLVVVDEASSTVELYTLNVKAADRGSMWPRFEVFNVALRADDAGANVDGWVASWRQEDMTIVCREMPRPIRFTGLKVELLFWVQGRVVLLENSVIEPHNYRMTVLPGDSPASIADGLPHVCTAFLPTDY